MGYLLHDPLVWNHTYLGDFCKVTKRRMEAYYYSFDSTGCDPVDKILGAVACAGKSFHHTDDWYEHASPQDDHTGGTPIDWIQNAAIEAAGEIERLRAAVAASRLGGIKEALSIMEQWGAWAAGPDDDGIPASVERLTEAHVAVKVLLKEDGR